MKVVTALPNHEHVFGKAERFSQALLWDWQTDYYHQTPDAIWPEIPSWLSSNRLHAQHYATLCCQYLQDLSAQQLRKPGEPVYIIDLGAGYGSLSAWLVDCLQQQKQRHGLQDEPTPIIRVDINPHAIAHWQNMPPQTRTDDTYPSDYAITDLAQLHTARLHHQKIPLTEILDKHPTLIIGHYILDTLPCDLYHRDHALQNHHLLCRLSTDRRNLLHQRQPKSLDKVHIEYQSAALTDAPYPEDHLNALLAAHLSSQPANSYSNFPHAALRLLEFFKQHTQHSTMVCLQDKGTWQQRTVADLGLAIHGRCFSHMVHFGVLQRYLKSWSHCHGASEPSELQAICGVYAPTTKALTNSTNTLKQLYSSQERCKLSIPTTMDYDATETTLVASQTQLATMTDDPWTIYIVIRHHLKLLHLQPALAMRLLASMTQHARWTPDTQSYDALATQAYWRLRQPQLTRQHFERLDTTHQHNLETLKAGIWCYQQTSDATKAQHLKHRHTKLRICITYHNSLACLQRIAQPTKRYFWLMASAAAVLYFIIQNVS